MFVLNKTARTRGSYVPCVCVYGEFVFFFFFVRPLSLVPVKKCSKSFKQNSPIDWTHTWYFKRSEYCKFQVVFEKIAKTVRGRDELFFYVKKLVSVIFFSV